MKDNTETLIQQLLEGSRRLDQMRAEVDKIVKMIIGLVLKIGQVQRARAIGYDFGLDEISCTWHIRGLLGGEKDSISVECWSKPGCCRVYSSDDPKCLEGSRIQEVYESLPLFISETLRNFPQLEREWAFILKAAERFN